MRHFYKSLLLLVAVILGGISAKAAGWPANYQGVMLQGFYWDSYNETGWKQLESQADELSKYFSLIWVPNSAKAATNPGMGYDPVYWFTNHNTAFGTEAQLRSMINTFKAKGTGIIADVVVNHRSGASNWTDFPSETWNGQTWHIGLDGICRDDEVKDAPGQATPTGNYDTGEGYGSSRDLDHTNANVQNNIKNYCKFLLTDLGYAGFRYDMVKGYGGQYTKIYNQYSNPTFSVGEYWDGNYDAVTAWIDATGKTSAAFDFPAKYCINDAFHNNDMTKLVWKANGNNDQPAGLIHFNYAQYAVTFVDNHDTYREGGKFNGNVVAANAFILCSPGTPCVFYPHYKQNKAAIQRLIDIRNSVGLHNNSTVNVLQSSRDCYMAEVTGKNGKLVVKIGSSMAAPSGYSNSDIVASGDGYCIWTKVKISNNGNGGNVDPEPNPTPSTPSELYILGDLKQGHWKTNVGVTMTKSGDKFTASNVELVANTGETKAFFSFTTAIGTTGDNTEWDDVINSSDRYGANTNNADIALNTPTDMTLFAVGVDASSANSWAVTPGTYTITADFSTMKVTVTGNGNVNPDPDPDPTPDPTPGDEVVIYFDNSNSNWTTPHIHYWGNTESAWPGVAMTKVEGNVWKYSCPAGTTGIIFNAGDGDATKTNDFVAINNHIYNTAGDQGTYTGNTPTPTPGDEVVIYFDNSNSNWTTPHIHYWGNAESVWPGVAMTKVEGNVWKYNCPAGTTGIIFNAGDGDATKTNDFVAINNHIYNTAGDQGTYTGNTPTPGDEVVIYFDNSNSNWTTPHIHYWGNAESVWPGVAMTNVKGNVWKYNCPAGTTGIIFNAGDGDATKTNDFVAINNHIYNTAGDQGLYNGVIPNPDPTPNPDASMWILGNLGTAGWGETPGTGVAMTKNGSIYTAKNVQFVLPEGATVCYFNITDFVGATWDDLNMGANRYGAASEGGPISIGIPAPVVMYANNVDASGCLSWTVAPGKYDVTLDIDEMTITLVQSVGSVDAIDADNVDVQPVYYNLQGVRVAEPTQGLYIVVRGNKVTKEIVR